MRGYVRTFNLEWNSWNKDEGSLLVKLFAYWEDEGHEAPIVDPSWLRHKWNGSQSQNVWFVNDELEWKKDKPHLYYHNKQSW